MKVAALPALAVALALLMLALVLGCNIAVPAGTAGDGATPGDQTETKAALGQPAPSFTLTDVDGRQFSLEELIRAGPTVLFFFCNT